MGSELLPGLDFLWHCLDFVLSFAMTALLFALLYKFVPDASITWRDVWTGATITALLFMLGKWLLGMYLGRESLSSAYGAAGSLVIFLAWVYYSAQILLFGAEFTQVYARKYGSKIVPHRRSLTNYKE